jgi:large subunit ribosomal protein L7/L12
MAEAITIDQIIERIDTMTILEVNELVKKIEDKYGVSAAPVAMAAGPAAAGPAAPVEEKTEFTVVLKEFPADKKIGIIKEVRAITGLGLKEAKDLVEAAPKEVVKDVNKEDAAKFEKQLKDAGAVVEIK